MNIRRFRKSYLVKIKKSHCQNLLANAIKGWSWRLSNIIFVFAVLAIGLEFVKFS